jgi:lipopolysaccharide export system protein LptA
MLRSRAWIGAGILAVALLALAFLFQHGRSSPGTSQALDTDVQGVDLTYYDFDKENRKKLEVKCRESLKQGEDQLRMKGVTATIFNADKLDEDIRITADSGTAGNDFNDFFLHGRARITSSDFSLASPSFQLKDLDVMTGKERVEFTLEGIRGRAVRGLQYFISQKVLKLFQSQGEWVHDGKPYDFRCRVFWVMRKSRMLVMEKQAVLSGEGTTVRSDWFSLHFDGDFSRLQKAEAIGNSSFRRTAVVDGREQGWDISGSLIQMHYDAQGRLQRQVVSGNGVVSLLAGKEVGTIRAEAIEITINPETQELEMARTLARGEVSGLGGERLVIAADSLQAVYGPGGTLAAITASGECRLDSGDFSGASSRLDHDVANSSVTISGKGTTVKSGRNRFQSSLFLLKTAAGEIETTKGVKATIIPAKKSVLLGARPVFVSADGMKSSSRKKITSFKGKVNLFQDEMELHAGELLFDDAGNRITAEGGAGLKFYNDGEQVALQGMKIAFDPGGSKIIIEGEAQLRQGPNTLGARWIELAFGRDDKLENIDASEQVTFSKGEITGKAQLLHWQYARKIILFRNAAEISRKGAGTTRGQELRFDIGSNQISVSDAGDRSETTIRNERP